MKVEKDTAGLALRRFISHTIKEFFVDNYDHEMFENGKQLIDMVYLKLEYKE